MSGRIHVIRGCMFSGKTARLIAHLCAAHDAGQRVLALKHSDDVRYDRDALATHDAQRFPALALSSADRLVDIALGSGVDVIGIDEGQFFGRGLVASAVTLRAAGCRVFVAGIDHDTWGRPFPPLPQLAEIADEAELLVVPCGACGRAARFSQRLTPVGPDGGLVGGPGDYAPRCQDCFVPWNAPAPEY